MTNEERYTHIIANEIRTLWYYKVVGAKPDYTNNEKQSDSQNGDLSAQQI